MILASRRLSVVLLLIAGACGHEAERPDAPAARTVVADSAAAPRIVFLGTSLTAGYGLPDPHLAYPTLIQQRLEAAGLRFEAVNAGVSGATSADSRRSIDWIMSRPVAVLVVETGANDGLRGLDTDSLKANLEAILARAARQSPSPRLILVGMEAPPNYGLDYTRRFRAVYPEVARTGGAVLVPFLLQGVAGIDSLNQGDGIHPTAAGQRLVADNVWQVLEPVLRDAGPSRR